MSRTRTATGTARRWRTPRPPPPAPAPRRPPRRRRRWPPERRSPGACDPASRRRGQPGGTWGDRLRERQEERVGRGRPTPVGGGYTGGQGGRAMAGTVRHRGVFATADVGVVAATSWSAASHRRSVSIHCATRRSASCSPSSTSQPCGTKPRPRAARARRGSARRRPHPPRRAGCRHGDGLVVAPGAATGRTRRARFAAPLWSRHRGCRRHRCGARRSTIPSCWQHRGRRCETSGGVRGPRSTGPRRPAREVVPSGLQRPPGGHRWGTTKAV